MNDCRLFKNETLVWKLLFTFLVAAAASNAFAVDSAFDPSKIPTCVKNFCKELSDGSCNENERKRYELLCAGQLEQSDNQDRLCRDAEKEFIDAKGEFDSACTASGMRGGGQTCSRRAFSCSECAGLAKGESDYSELCSDLAVEEEFKDTDEVTDIQDGGVNAFEDFDLINQRVRYGPRSRNMFTTRETIQRKSPTAMYANCPAMASSSIDDFEKQADKYESKTRKLQEQINRKQQSMMDAATDMQSDQQKVQEDMEAIRLDLQKEVKALSEANEKQLLALQQQMAKLGETLSQLVTARTQAQQEYLDQMSALRVTCHQEALKRVNEERAERLKAINERRYSTNSVNKLFKSTGINSRRKSQRKAKRYYKDCTRSSLIAEQKGAIERAYKLKTDGLQATHSALMQQQQLLIQEMGKIPAKNQESLQLAQQDANSRMQRAQRIYFSKMQRNTNKQNKLRMDMQQLENYKAADEDYLLFYQDSLNKAYHYSRGVKGDPQEFSSSLTKASTAASAAAEVIYACNCISSCPDKSRSGEEQYGSTTLCDSAKEYYNDFQAKDECGSATDSSGTGGGQDAESP